MFKIAVGAGHGGYGVTPGKRSPANEYEWDFNNKVVVAFMEEMKNYDGVEVRRMDDPTGRTDVPLKTRTDKANAWGADIYISFHHNANTGVWGTWTGTETFTYLGSNPNSERLASLVHPEIVKAYGLRDRGLKKENFHIVRETKMAAILVEGGYMDSTIDIKKLRNDSVLKNAGIGAAHGAAKYGGLKRKAAPVTPSELYRVRKSWSDASSQIGAFSELDGAISVAKANTGYNVYNEAGKQVYPEVQEQMYRVRKSWSDASTQIGAFSELENAKELADQNPGYTVYDNTGKAVYAYSKPEPQLYRVRIDWKRPETQIGAFSELDNAKELADKNPNHKVFDKDGKNVYTPTVEAKPEPKPEEPKPEPVDPHKGHHNIMGSSSATREQMVTFLRAKNPEFKDTEEIVDAFLEVGKKYGLRGDVAFCQSIIETGWFKFTGGTAVTPDQHNYCGMGVTSKGMKGASFKTAKDGVTAQIQHLFAYASYSAIPSEDELLDPRFKYVARGIAPHWEDLNMRWAMNDNYGQHILSVHEELLKVVPTKPEEPVVEAPVEEKPKCECGMPDCKCEAPNCECAEGECKCDMDKPKEEEEKLNVGLFNKLIEMIYNLLMGWNKKK